MILHLLTRRDVLLEPTTGADKSAMGAVNRPLRRSLAYTWFIHPNPVYLLCSREKSGNIAAMGRNPANSSLTYVYSIHSLKERARFHHLHLIKGKKL